MGVNSGVGVRSISVPIISSSPTSFGLSNEGDGVGVGVGNGGAVVMREDGLVGSSVSSWGVLSLGREIWQARVDIVMSVILIVVGFIFRFCILLLLAMRIKKLFLLRRRGYNPIGKSTYIQLPFPIRNCAKLLNNLCPASIPLQTGFVQVSSIHNCCD